MLYFNYMKVEKFIAGGVVCPESIKYIKDKYCKTTISIWISEEAAQRSKCKCNMAMLIRFKIRTKNMY